MNFEEAKRHSLTVPWKLKVCHTGEDCWCRIILPIEQIFYTYKFGDIPETIEELDYIIPDGSIDKETAEYFVQLHNDSLRA